MVTAAVAALVGAALNVLRIYEESVDEDQQRLIPEELRYEFIMPKIIKIYFQTFVFHYYATTRQSPAAALCFM